MSTLTKDQQQAIKMVRNEGADFIAGASERFWSNGQKYYIDSRVRVSKATRQAFKKANDQVKR